MLSYGISFPLQIPPVVCKATTIDSRNSSEVFAHERWYTLQAKIRQKNKNSQSISLQRGQPASRRQTFRTRNTFFSFFFRHLFWNLCRYEHFTLSIHFQIKNPCFFLSVIEWYESNFLVSCSNSHCLLCLTRGLSGSNMCRQLRHILCKSLPTKRLKLFNSSLACVEFFFLNIHRWLVWNYRTWQ